MQPLRPAIAGLALAIASFAGLLQPAAARPVCLVVADAASGAELVREGDCGTRVTPASTFKLALAVMGFDSGFLANANEPVIDFREGFPAWGGAEWRKPADPARWMRYSVVWYSRFITHHLGVEGIERYSRSFGYGNADLTGDPGKDNGLDRGWISSSLRISPDEQVRFLRRFVNRDLPVSTETYRLVERIIQKHTLAGNWVVAGKTGSAYPYKADGSFDRKRAWGWYVGWAGRGDTTLVFARLDEVDATKNGSSGLYVRGQFLDNWSQIAEAAER